MIEHADDLARFVIHDFHLLLVVECWHRESARVILLGVEVDITEMGKTVVQRIWSGVVARLLFVLRRESPPCAPCQ